MLPLTSWCASPREILEESVRNCSLRIGSPIQLKQPLAKSTAASSGGVVFLKIRFIASNLLYIFSATGETKAIEIPRSTMSTEVESDNVRKLREGLNTLNEGLGSMKENAARYGQSAAEEIEALRLKLNQYQDRSKELLEVLAEFIRENPQHAALLAATTGLGLGLILGLILRRG